MNLLYLSYFITFLKSLLFQIMCWDGRYSPHFVGDMGTGIPIPFLGQLHTINSTISPPLVTDLGRQLLLFIQFWICSSKKQLQQLHSISKSRVHQLLI